MAKFNIKTRIKVIEKNNGTKLYVGQVFCPESIVYGILGFPLKVLLFMILLLSDVIDSFTGKYGGAAYWHRNRVWKSIWRYADNTFYLQRYDQVEYPCEDMNTAKALIDLYLKQERDIFEKEEAERKRKRAHKYDRRTKTTKYIKYP